jgi:hypothetical protein
MLACDSHGCKRAIAEVNTAVYVKQGAWWIDWYEGGRRPKKRTGTWTGTETRKLLRQVNAKVLPRELGLLDAKLSRAEFVTRHLDQWPAEMPGCVEVGRLDVREERAALLSRSRPPRGPAAVDGVAPGRRRLGLRVWYEVLRSERRRMEKLGVERRRERRAFLDDAYAGARVPVDAALVALRAV